MGLEVIANQIEQNQERIAAGEAIARAAHQPAIVQHVSAEEMGSGKRDAHAKLRFLFFWGLI